MQNCMEAPCRDRKSVWCCEQECDTARRLLVCMLRSLPDPLFRSDMMDINSALALRHCVRIACSSLRVLQIDKIRQDSIMALSIAIFSLVAFYVYSFRQFQLKIASSMHNEVVNTSKPINFAPLLRASEGYSSTPYKQALSPNSRLYRPIDLGVEVKFITRYTLATNLQCIVH